MSAWSCDAHAAHRGCKWQETPDTVHHLLHVPRVLVGIRAQCCAARMAACLLVWGVVQLLPVKQIMAASWLGWGFSRFVRFHKLAFMQDFDSEHPGPCCCVCRQLAAPSSCSVRASSRMHEVRSGATSVSPGEQLGRAPLFLACPCCQLEALASRTQPAKGVAACVHAHNGNMESSVRR